MSKVSSFELLQRSTALGAIAGKGRRVVFDNMNDAIDPTHFDAIHDNCVALLSALAKSGHRRSHELLNTSRQAAQDSAPQDAKAIAALGAMHIGL